MKILMILDSEFPSDIRVGNEIESLLYAGYRVHLACYTRKKRKKYETIGKLTIHRKPISRFIYKSSVGCLKFPFYFNFWRKFLKELFCSYSFDAIHIHDLPLAKVAKELSVKHQIPFVLDLHENWPAAMKIAVHTNTFLGKILSSNRQWQSYERKMLFQADKIIVVVEEARERLIKLEVNPEKISVVSNTLNLKHFQLPVRVPDHEYVTLFYAGGLNIHRGIQNIITSLPAALKKTPNLRFCIVGSGSYQKTLERLTNSLGLGGIITFTGWKNLQELAEFLMRSDIALIPHLKSEHTDSTVPHKLFQYIYAGKLILAANCAPLKRIIEETNTGLIFNDPAQIANKIVTLVSNKEEYDSLKKKKWVEEKYNWKNDAETLIAIYSNLEQNER